jgi:hypothetical protein
MQDDATRPIGTGRMQAKSVRGEPDDQLAPGRSACPTSKRSSGAERAQSPGPPTLAHHGPLAIVRMPERR